MQALNPLTTFFTSIAHDPRIGITHIGLYAAVVQYWQDHEMVNPVRAYGREIMYLAKIRGTATYHKCIRELSEYGYIRYEASYNKKEGSQIYLILKCV